MKWFSQILSMTSVRLANILVLALGLEGCGASLLASRDTNPVIQDYTASLLHPGNLVTTFGTTASRRIALVQQEKDKFQVCSEPPPDVGEAFASAIAAGLAASADVTVPEGPKGSGSLAAQYARAAATQIAPLIYRTQGLQVLRDSNFSLCIDYMNGWIARDKYLELKEARFESALQLIRAELPLLEKTTGAYWANVKAGEAKINVDDVVKIIDAQKAALKETQKAPAQ